MPRIREYEQQISAGGGEIQGRRAQPGDTYAFGADLGKGLAQTADILQDAADRQEVSDVQARLAKARADWTVHLAQRAQETSPGDATFAGKFNEDFSKYLQTIEGGLQTRAGQETFRLGAAKLSAHFVERAGVYQAQAMGAKAVQDYNVALDSHRNTLISDPTQFKAVEEQALSALNDPRGLYARMPAAEREKLTIATRQTLAMSAVQGLIQNGAPELAKRQLQGGQWDAYLDADKKAALVDRADVGIRAKDSEAERQRQLAEREKRERQDGILKGFLARIIDPKANGGALSDREVLASTDLTAAQQQHVIDYKRARAKELAGDAENRKNPFKVRELVNQMIAADSDPSKTFSVEPVREAYRKNQISTPELVFLERFFGQLKDGSTNTFARDLNTHLSTVSRMVTGSIDFVGRTAEAITVVNQIREDAFNAVEEYRSQNKNPRELLNPKSKDYLFSTERLQTYMRSPRAAVADEAGRIRAEQPATGRLPTHRDYDKLKSGAQYTDPDGNVRTKR
jgi:hypothetical protein